MIEEILIEMLYDDKLIDENEKNKTLEFFKKYDKICISKTYNWSLKEI